MAERLSTLGLRVAEHEVLATLARAPGITQQDLAARCFVAKSGISMLLAQMEADRRVVREVDPADARARRLSLTAAGAALARRSMALHAEVIEAMVDGSSEAELAAVVAAMERAAAALERLRAAPSLSPASAPRSRPPPPARRG